MVITTDRPDHLNIDANYCYFQLQQPTDKSNQHTKLVADLSVDKLRESNNTNTHKILKIDKK